ncbi:MAG: hypothetical protein O3A06_06320 [Proteobacteria bacterium]|nr:hypothetical protein [Pseudomonadota bacterium]MDA0982636.1 hypothetical protein [Pseudomonadota bacterium]
MEAEIIGSRNDRTRMVHRRKRRHHLGAFDSGKIVVSWLEEGLARVGVFGMDSAYALLIIADPAGEPSPHSFDARPITANGELKW